MEEAEHGSVRAAAGPLCQGKADIRKRQLVGLAAGQID
jgi:hypothetical protein